MTRFQSTLGFLGAGLTVAAAVLIPLGLMQLFARGVAGTGVRIDPSYTGGPERFSVAREGYRIVVHEPVRPRAPLQRLEPYVQIDFGPAGRLPAVVADHVDIDGDGRLDVAVRFAVPPDPKTRLRASLVSTSAAVKPVDEVGRESLSRLIARIGDRIVVRVPLSDARP